MKALYIILFTTIFIMSFNSSFSQTRLARQDEKTAVRGITPARARSLVGVVVGIVSIVIGVRGKRRNKRALCFYAIGTASLAIILGIIHLSTVSGHFGTGGGKAGAIAALVLGTIGVAFGMLTLMMMKKPTS